MKDEDAEVRAVLGEFAMARVPLAREVAKLRAALRQVRAFHPRVHEFAGRAADPDYLCALCQPLSETFGHNDVMP